MKPVLLIDGKKKCSKCGIEKEALDFHKAPKKPSGLSSQCKKCRNKTIAMYAAANPEKGKERSKTWRLLNSEKAKEQSKAWVKDNPEKRKAIAARAYEKSKDKLLPAARIRAREWYAENKERALAASKGWAENNRDKVNQYKKNWKESNAESVRLSDIEYRKRHKEQRLEYNRHWRVLNIDKARELGREATAKRLATPKGKLSSNVSKGIRESLKAGKAGRHWESLVDFTVDQLKTHIEKLFKPGMTWENYGTSWHIDHKIPIAAFNFERPDDIDFRICWSLKNLQPLEASINMSKGDRIDKPFQPSLAIAV